MTAPRGILNNIRTSAGWTILGLLVALFVTLSAQAQSDSGEFFDDPFVDEFPEENVEPIIEDDFDSDLPFQPRRAKRNTDDGSGQNPRDKGAKSGDGNNNDRFGQPKNKIVFRLVDDEKIKESIKTNTLAVSPRPIQEPDKVEANAAPTSSKISR
jgi:hypothetical protein